MTQASVRNSSVVADKNKSVATDKAIQDFTNTQGFNRVQTLNFVEGDTMSYKDH